MSILGDESISKIEEPKLERRKTTATAALSEQKKSNKLNMQIKLMREVEENMKNFSKEVDQVDKK